MNAEQSPQPQPGRPVDPELTRSIVHATLDGLAEVGYSRLNTADIARRAGVSTATLYRRWRTKHDLILSVASMLGDDAEPSDTGTLRDDLRSLLRRKRDVLSGSVGDVLVSMVGEANHDTELAAIIRDAVFRTTRRHLELILRREQERTTAPLTTDLDSAAHIVVGTVLSNLAFGEFSSNDSHPALPALLPDTQIEALTRSLDALIHSQGTDPTFLGAP